MGTNLGWSSSLEHVVCTSLKRRIVNWHCQYHISRLISDIIIKQNIKTFGRDSFFLDKLFKRCVIKVWSDMQHDVYIYSWWVPRAVPGCVQWRLTANRFLGESPGANSWWVRRGFPGGMKRCDKYMFASASSAEREPGQDVIYLKTKIYLQGQFNQVLLKWVNLN